MLQGSFPSRHLPSYPGDARPERRRQVKKAQPSLFSYSSAGLGRAAENQRPRATQTAADPGSALRRGLCQIPATPSPPRCSAPKASPPAASELSVARVRRSARRRNGDGHEMLAARALANGSARHGETRTSLFQDGGASVASNRPGGKPAKPSKAAARERTEGAVAAVGGGPGSFRCCYGCCHAARLGRSKLPWGVIMLTEVSGDGGHCLPVQWGRGRRRSVRANCSPSRRARLASRGCRGQRSIWDSTCAPWMAVVPTRHSPTTSSRLCLFRSRQWPIAPGQWPPSRRRCPRTHGLLGSAPFPPCAGAASVAGAAGSCPPTVGQSSPRPPGPSTSRLGQHPRSVSRPYRLVLPPHSRSGPACGSSRRGTLLPCTHHHPLASLTGKSVRLSTHPIGLLHGQTLGNFSETAFFLFCF